MPELKHCQSNTPEVDRQLDVAGFDDSGLARTHPQAAANEVVFAVVGHVGSGTSEVADSLKDSLSEKKFPGGPFEVHMLKARDVIRTWAPENHETQPDETKRVSTRLSDSKTSAT